MGSKISVTKTVEEIWCDILGVDQVVLDDNFFAMGGDSLMIVRMLSNVDSAIGIKLSALTLFDHPTLEEFCAVICGLCRS